MVEYSIVTEDNLLYCTVSGVVRTSDFQNYVQNLLQDEKFHQQLDAIIQIKSDLVVSYGNEAEGIGKVLSQFLRQRKKVYWALVAPNQTTKCIVNLIIQEVDSTHISVSYFESREEAKAWIKEVKLSKKKPTPVDTALAF